MHRLFTPCTIKIRDQNTTRKCASFFTINIASKKDSRHSIVNPAAEEPNVISGITFYEKFGVQKLMTFHGGNDFFVLIEQHQKSSGNIMQIGDDTALAIRTSSVCMGLCSPPVVKPPRGLV